MSSVCVNGFPVVFHFLCYYLNSLAPVIFLNYYATDNNVSKHTQKSFKCVIDINQLVSVMQRNKKTCAVGHTFHHNNLNEFVFLVMKEMNLWLLIYRRMCFSSVHHTDIFFVLKFCHCCCSVHINILISVAISEQTNSSMKTLFLSFLSGMAVRK